MQVPTREQIAEALRVPEVKPDLDRMGRVKTKNVRSDITSIGQQIHKERMKKNMFKRSR
jgi:hypothetical protein